MNDRFRYRIPVYKNNEFDGYVYICLGDKIPDLHGGRYGMPEQCTELRDKNCKLIYEGDIVKIDEDLATINWSVHYARFMLDSEEDFFGFDSSYVEDCEVIGNIHKKP